MSRVVAIVDYGSGNLHSAAKALQRAASEVDGSFQVVVTAVAEQVADAERVVLPGVGAFADCRRGLLAVDGMWQAIESAAIVRGRPFLGICVGMQLMAVTGLEHGRHSGFGWIAGEVRAIEPRDRTLKVPQMGWNALDFAESTGHPLFAGIEAGAYVYFLNSYHLVPRDLALVLATVEYGGQVTAAVGRDNLAGVQFHPEKSQAVGLTLLRNFLAWQP